MAKEKILIIDDELAVRLALKTAFVREGMEVDEAACGEDGLKRIGEQTYDLIVLDVMMQGYGRIRHSPETPGGRDHDAGAHA